MNESELREIAAQLACPSGDHGIGVGEKMNEANAVMIARSIESLAATTGECIVEIGPGNGILSLPIIESIGSNGHYIGVERSADMAAQTIEILKQDKSTQIDMYVGDCMSADIASNSIDGLMAVNVLYFIDDIDAFFKKLLTWLKPGARVVFGVRSQRTLEALPFTRFGFHIRSQEEIIEKLAANGFLQMESQCFVEVGEKFDNEIAMDFLIIKAVARCLMLNDQN